MKLIYERSIPGHKCDILPDCDVEVREVPAALKRETAARLPEIAEVDLARHYTELSKQTFGVNCGFYPLGSCTMKYNPRINEVAAALPGFTSIHPLQPPETTKGCQEILDTAKKYLCEIAGMDDMTFQPAAGAHGEFTGLLLIKAYHRHRGDDKRTKIIVPDSAHGTNPASSSMADFEAVNIDSDPNGCVDLDALRAAVGPDTAGLMLTNPNTAGRFDHNILEITKIIHEAGGLCYYDGANLNAVAGVVRPGDMGFDVVHLNLHKTFSTPHGGGGPGAGAVGCKKELAQFLPHSVLVHQVEGTPVPETSIGQVRAFTSNFLVVVRAVAYLLYLGNTGSSEASRNAVLNANYLMNRLKDTYSMAYPAPCMHEFVIDVGPLEHETGVNALDIAKCLLDNGMHPPTMYFPLIVHEALMVEPTETESKQTLDDAVDTFISVYNTAKADPEAAHKAPQKTPLRRLDEVGAARNPHLRYNFEEDA